MEKLITCLTNLLADHGKFNSNQKSEEIANQSFSELALDSLERVELILEVEAQYDVVFSDSDLIGVDNLTGLFQALQLKLGNREIASIENHLSSP